MDLATRFWSKVVRESDEGCWNWTAYVNEKGYGRMMINGKPRGAHRIAYELTIGPIPEGMQLDHLCRNRRCVNPAHLEPVTNRENSLRGTGFGGVNARATHCINGHPFEGDNLNIRANGGRECLACKKAHYVRTRERLLRNAPL